MNTLFKFLRILFSGILIYFIFTRIDLQEATNLFSHAKFSYLIPIALIIAFDYVVESYKCNLLLKAKRIYIPLMKMFNIIYIGSFLGFALPSAISVDIMRGYGLYKHLAGKEESISSMIINKILGFASLVIVAIGSFLLFFVFGINNNAFPMIFSVLLIFFIVIALLLTIVVLSYHFVWNLVEKHFSGNNPLLVKIKQLYLSLQGYKACPVTLLSVISLSGAIHISRVLVFFLVSLYLGLKIPLFYFFIFVPIILLITRLPISIGGIGVREGAFVYLFGTIGLPPSHVFPIPLLISILSVISILPAGVLYAAKGFSTDKSQLSMVRGEEKT